MFMLNLLTLFILFDFGTNLCYLFRYKIGDPDYELHRNNFIIDILVLIICALLYFINVKGGF